VLERLSLWTVIYLIEHLNLKIQGLYDFDYFRFYISINNYEQAILLVFWKDYEIYLNIEKKIDNNRIIYD